MTLRQDQLRPASIRGVPCFVADAGMEAGRRLQVHEYPQRDKPWAEDLGRATRSMALTVFVVGNGYIEHANRLLEALEAEGPGTLVHPWLGTMQVSFGISRVSFKTQDLGYAEFQITCTEAGDLAFPNASSSTQGVSRLSADELQTSSLGEFENNFTVEGVPDFVVDDGVANLGGVLSFLQQPVPGLESLELAERVGSASQSVVDSIRQPGKLGLQLAGALNIANYVGSVTRWSAVVQGLVRMATGPSLAEPLPPAVTTANRLQAWRNSVAVNALARRLLLTQAIGASSVMEATVYDDVVSVSGVLTSALDAEALTAGDSAYLSLQGARVAVWRDLSARARGAARLKSYRPSMASPSLAIAYSLYGDATREGEIVARNRVRHPGFVPAQPLQVLTS